MLSSIRPSITENENNDVRRFNERINAIDCSTNLDTDKVVDCTVAAMEQSIIRNKLNQNDDDTSDNDMDDEDDEGNTNKITFFFYITIACIKLR